MATKVKAAETTEVEVKQKKASTSKTATKEPSERKSSKVAVKEEVAVEKKIKAAKTTVISHEMICQRAYEIWQKTGCSNQQENWLKAEKELKSSLN